MTSNRDRLLIFAESLCSYQQQQTPNESLIRTLLYRCFLAETISVNENSKKKCARICFWSDQIALKSFSDVRPSCARNPFRQVCAQIHLGSDRPRPKWPLIRKVPHHCARSVFQTNLEVVKTMKISTLPVENLNKMFRGYIGSSSMTQIISLHFIFS